MRAVTFNAFVGQPPAQLEANLRELARDTDHPHVIALQEATRWGGTIPRYRRVAADDLERPEAAACVLLVHDGVTMRRRRPIVVQGPGWIGPHLDLKHPPRVFPSVAVKDGRWWELADVHRVTGGKGRNAEAYAAEGRALEVWSDHRRPGRSQAMLGDWNGIPRGLAKRVGGHLHLHGIDGAVVVNGDAEVTELRGLYGSDTHHPVMVHLTHL